jgi:hypothetical protein
VEIVIKNRDPLTARTCHNKTNLTKISERKTNDPTISVENTSDPDIYTVLALEAVCQGLGDTLSLIIASARTDRVDMSPTTNHIHE